MRRSRGARLACVLVVGACAALPRGVAAAWGDLALGAQAVAALDRAEVGPALYGDLGVTDLIKLRASAQARLGEGGAVWQGTLGVVLALDVLTWVPELSAEGGARLSDGHVSLVGAGMVGVRRYLDVHWFLGAWAGALWHDGRVRPNASFGAGYDFL